MFKERGDELGGDGWWGSGCLVVPDRLCVDADESFCVDGDCDDVCALGRLGGLVERREFDAQELWCAFHEDDAEDEEREEQEDDVEKGRHLDAWFW